MTSTEIKDWTQAIVYATIAFGCTISILVIIYGGFIEYKDSLDRLIGVLMVIAGLQADEVNQWVK